MTVCLSTRAETISDPRAATTAGGLANTYSGGIDVAQRICSVDGCDGVVVARGWCRAHYTRWDRYGDPTAGSPSTRGSLAERFWRKVAQSNRDGCWEWTGTRLPTGYGAIRSGGRGPMLRANRVSWELHNGTIPEGLHVLHRCDNPPCVNPAHLFLGTIADNAADKVAKGRQPRGEAVRHARLTVDAVKEIRGRYAAGGVTQAALSREYGVSEETIRQIILRRKWAHVS